MDASDTVETGLSSAVCDADINAGASAYRLYQILWALFQNN